MRWASKTGSYQSVFGKDLAVIVFVTNLSVIIAFLLAVFKTVSWQSLGILFTLKFMFDYILLYKSNRFLTAKRMRYVIVSSVLYPFFV